jgi:hypothetical protein
MLKTMFFSVFFFFIEQIEYFCLSMENYLPIMHWIRSAYFVLEELGHEKEFKIL